MAQYALPTSDVVLTNWTEGAGDGDGDAFDELDEGFGAGRGSGSGPDDATTYWETTNEVTNELRTGLSTVTDPVTDTGHEFRGRNRKNTAAGRQIDITMRLRVGGVLVVGNTFTNVDNVWTTREVILTAPQADSISDYTILRIGTLAIETGGGSPKIGWESAHEFECPDAAPPTGVDEMMAAIGQQTGGGGGSGDIMAHSRKPPEAIAY